MKYTLFFFAFVFILCVGCSSDDIANNATQEVVDDFYIESYHGYYAIYNGSLSPSSSGDNKVKFVYDDQSRIIERTGNIAYTSSGSGAIGYLHDSLYTEVTYENNKAVLTKKIHPFGGFSQVRQHVQTVTFDAQNRMTQKISFIENNNPEELDTIHYTYLNNKLIKYVKTNNSDFTDYSLRRFMESDLYYSNGNLDSIVTIKTRKWSDEPYVIITGKEVEIFSQYDTAKNPFRKLSMFDETFYRSLSKNNFSDYRKIVIPYNYPNWDYTQPGFYGPRFETKFQTWSFAYDEEGEWIYYDF